MLLTHDMRASIYAHTHTHILVAHPSNPPQVTVVHSPSLSVQVDSMILYPKCKWLTLSCATSPEDFGSPTPRFAGPLTDSTQRCPGYRVYVYVCVCGGVCCIYECALKG